MANGYNCIFCKHGVNTDDYEHCSNCDKGSEFLRMSNADRIRSMSDSELAEWLAGIDHYWDDGECIVNFGVVRIHDSKVAILDWLQEEVEG